MSTLINGVLSTAANSFTGSASAHSKDSPEKIKESAGQFEALMIGQILKSMHGDSEEGWLGTGEDQTSSSAMGMADEYFAKALASKGGLGLAQMISTSIAKRGVPPTP
jgi:Rod binding domain-containing protein